MEASSWEHPYPTLPDPIPLAERRNTAAATLFLDCLISCEMCLQPVTWLPLSARLQQDITQKYLLPNPKKGRPGVIRLSEII